jgi:excinuclease ABC subunit A
LGPEGGDGGGQVVGMGNVSEIIKNTTSYTGQFLSEKITKDVKRLNNKQKQRV